MGLESEHKQISQIEAFFRSSPKIETTILRVASLIGYSRHPSRFFASGKVIKDPDGYVNLIHRDDCIAIITQLIDDDIWGEAFNCCTDTHSKKRDHHPKAEKSNLVHNNQQ